MSQQQSVNSSKIVHDRIADVPRIKAIAPKANMRHALAKMIRYALRPVSTMASIPISWLSHCKEAFADTGIVERGHKATM